MTLLHDLVDLIAVEREGRPALRHRGVETSYGDLKERSRQLASSFARLGVTRGDRVATYLQNRTAMVEIALACSRLGAIFVPANAALRARQLAHVLGDCTPRLLVLSLARDESVTLNYSVPVVVACDSPDAGSASALNMVRYEDLFGMKPWTAQAGIIDRDPAAILYTSGSTGGPKGVVVSHANLVCGARIVSGYLRNTAEDRILAALPLSFDYGLSQVTTALSVGACAVLTNFTLTGALLHELDSERITGLAGVPTMWAHLAGIQLPPAAIRSLRYITNSGGALTGALQRTLAEKLPNAEIYCMYGLTEAFRSTFLDPAQISHRTGSIGKALPDQEVLVLRPDGTRCAPGEIGELVHRGSLVTLGYWNAPDLTAQRFRPLPVAEGRVRDDIAVWSGDQVRTDEDGYLYFVGRTDALIKTSGYRVSPAEIEEVVAGVGGVQESCAVGLADAALGHRVALAIVAAPGESRGELVARVQQHCRTQLPSYMVPAEIRVCEEIPRNTNGKHDRLVLARKWYDPGASGIPSPRAAGIT